MKLISSMLILALTFGLSACSTNGIEGRYSYDTAIDYSDMKSFSLLSFDDNYFSTPQSAAHYRQAMVTALTAKGFTEDSQAPDFAVQTFPVSTYREEFVTSDAGRVQLPKALLRVNFVHPSLGSHIYEGVAGVYYYEGAPQEERNALIDHAVDVILSGFPPGRE